MGSSDREHSIVAHGSFAQHGVALGHKLGKPYQLENSFWNPSGPLVLCIYVRLGSPFSSCTLPSDPQSCWASGRWCFPFFFQTRKLRLRGQ